MWNSGASAQPNNVDPNSTYQYSKMAKRRSVQNFMAFYSAEWQQDKHSGLLVSKDHL